jgi:hypothetical protein
VGVERAVELRTVEWQPSALFAAIDAERVFLERCKSASRIGMRFRSLSRDVGRIKLLRPSAI